MVKIIIIGFIAGLISGLFSTGGGMILVPAFLYLLKMKSVEARATSITCILTMVITSSIFYYQNKYIDWKIGFLCAIGGIIGGYVGTKFLKKIPEPILNIVFIVLILYVALYMLGIKFI